MINRSFAVEYTLPQYRKTVIVLGVTSIVPNMNGVLMFTENGDNHFIESYDMKDKMLSGMSIDYDMTEEDIQYTSDYCERNERKFVLVDGRNK